MLPDAEMMLFIKASFFQTICERLSVKIKDGSCVSDGVIGSICVFHHITGEQELVGSGMPSTTSRGPAAEITSLQH